METFSIDSILEGLRREKGKKEWREDAITHKEMEEILTQFMLINGWTRLKGNSKKGEARLDRTFRKQDTICVFEVKPGYSTPKEIVSAIGQCSTILPDRKTKPYIFITKNLVYHIEAQLPYLPWLGVIVLDLSNKEVIFYQRSQLAGTL